MVSSSLLFSRYSMPLSVRSSRTPPLHYFFMSTFPPFPSLISCYSPDARAAIGKEINFFVFLLVFPTVRTVQEKPASRLARVFCMIQSRSFVSSFCTPYRVPSSGPPPPPPFLVCIRLLLKEGFPFFGAPPPPSREPTGSHSHAFPFPIPEPSPLTHRIPPCPSLSVSGEFNCARP